MEQNPHPPNYSPELPPVSASPDRRVEGDVPSPEISPGGMVELSNQATGTAMEAEGSHAATTALPSVATPPVTSIPDPQGQTSSGLPSTANDDDLIEKEWVEKAKKVIEETKDDPYQREHEVKKLQADYLFKRYGRGV